MLLPLCLLASALLCCALIIVMKPLLMRYALARPNGRSSHRVPTPQGGGIAVVAATLLVTGLAMIALRLPLDTFALMAAATIALALVGAIDDIRPLPAKPRLLLQVLAVIAILYTTDLRIFPDTTPLMVERAFLLLGGVWFVNLVNFMDGLDWITVAEMAPLTAFLSAAGYAGILPALPTFVAVALCGALLAFAVFNKPVAKLFLGDVGSLPIGLMVGWLLLQLAVSGGLAAAILLPLYFLLDATVTLLRRLARREKVWEAHRLHFYQQATDNGFTAMGVSLRVFGLNILLGLLAAITLLYSDPMLSLVCLMAGLALVILLMRRFARKPEVRP